MEDAMVSTILVPLDGSALARHALPFAAFMARTTHARLVLLHAYRPRSLDPEADPELDLIREHADLASGLRERGVHASTWLSYTEPGPAIVETAADLQVDLIVMSTHGRGGVGHLIYGSVAEYVARHSTVPVILVTSRSRSCWAEDLPVRIVVPLDGSAHSETALGPAGVLARDLQADLLLLTSTESTLDPAMPWHAQSGPTWRRAIDKAQQYLERAALPLRMEGHRVELRVVIGPPSDAIADAANELGAAIVVMATHGRGALSRLLLESVASETLRKLAVPVCLIRPHEVDEVEAVSARIERSRA
jgi:nucleotide-binding universal stress UspA family protein